MSRRDKEPDSRRRWSRLRVPDQQRPPMLLSGIGTPATGGAKGIVGRNCCYQPGAGAGIRLFFETNLQSVQRPAARHNGARRLPRQRGSIAADGRCGNATMSSARAAGGQSARGGSAGTTGRRMEEGDGEVYLRSFAINVTTSNMRIATTTKPRPDVSKRVQAATSQAHVTSSTTIGRSSTSSARKPQKSPGA